MLINVKVFADLREKISPKPKIGEVIKIEINQNETVRDVIKKIKLNEEDIAIIFINGVHTTFDHKLTEEDKSISFFSPAGGG